ncbi:MAG: Hsp33 family molecular chaperone HslO [Clostridia bacterium]|nr:Hsp33 family molecular chaperone HslO [Clostridia bacterium]
MPGVIKRAITKDGSARLIITDSTDIVKKACDIHGMSKTMTAVLGRALTATSLMGSLLKDRDNTITLQFRGNGPCGSIVCVGDYKGNVKGYCDDMTVELPPNSQGKLDVGGAVGRGSMYVIKDLGMAEPYIGVSPIVSGEIAEDITEYYAQSEQTPTVCSLGVRVDRDNMCYAAGGYLIQLMPGYDESIVDILEENVKKTGSISRLIADKMSLEDIAAGLFDGIGYEFFDEFDTDYHCGCTREKYLRSIAGLSDSDIKGLSEKEEPVEAVCSFCGKKYSFSIKEILETRENMRKAPDGAGNE